MEDLILEILKSDDATTALGGAVIVVVYYVCKGAGRYVKQIVDDMMADRRAYHEWARRKLQEDKKNETKGSNPKRTA